MATRFSISMSPLGSALAEQCAAQGLIATGTDIAMSERLADAVNLLYVRGLMTDAQCDAARKKIIVGMKLRAALPPSGAGEKTL
jgi:hypothetical protein